MKYFARLALISALISFLGANAETKSLTDSITVSGRITNIPEKGSRTLIINECDTYKKNERRIVDIDSSGFFCERIPFSSAHTFTINYRPIYINAFAEPGDSIHVDIDASASPIGYHLSGDHATFNDQYSHAFENLAPVYSNVKLLPDTAALDDYMHTFKKEVAKTQTIVDEYVKQHSISDEVAAFLRIDNIYIIANQALEFTGKNKDEQLRFFTDPIFDLFNEENAKVMMYPYHLKGLCFQFPEYVETVPKSHIRDLMYAAIGEEGNPPRENFSDPAYYDRIYSTDNKNINIGAIKPGEIIVMEGDSITKLINQNPLEWISKQYGNRPVYLDISATWCGSCLNALATSESVRDHFKNSDILFVILWLKSDIKSWEKIAPTIHNAIHIFIPDDDMSNHFIGVFKIHGFPSYFFLNPDGSVLHDEVPRFNHSDLPEFLKSKLNL